MIKIPIKKQGFSLFEILIALLIFSILAVITTTALKNIFDTRDRTITHNERIAAIQITMALVRQDLYQLIARSTTMNYRKQPALIGNQHNIEFTRGGNVNPLAQEKRSTLSRVAYIYTKNELIRRSYFHLDTSNHAVFEDTILIDKIKNVTIAYMDDSLSVFDKWEQNKLPRAIRIDIALKNEGDISEVYPLPEGVTYALSLKKE